ncbi:hypothetical protein B0T17DRAFT_498750 [Bombardia bombarda]|uniref:Actin-related protein 10 n=1 Tax=Bombardia bombarda TaxID=252184 RepID=A0AA39TMK5_9PEZI|nr:hypothetical protein B0T17DRAFT_498750 [Bombardia bombarda]
MSTSTGSAILPHRSVANIRTPAGAGGQSSGLSTPNRPNVASNFGSPSSLRAEEDILIIEFGTRKLQIGFAGDAVPRGSIWFGPDQQRRVGDFREWQADYHHDWRKGASGDRWGKDHELWQSDIRGFDLGLMSDKLERVLRDAYTRYLLIDSRPRRIVCVLPSGLPIPLLSASLDCLFSRFSPPTISLMSSEVALTAAAGMRSALVIDMGWNETVVTSIYEYREVQCSRTIRGGRMLTEQTHHFLASYLPQTQKKPANENSDKTKEYVLSFEECDDVASRLVWCKPFHAPNAAEPGEGLQTVEEHDDESGENNPTTPTKKTSGITTVPLKSSGAPISLELPSDSLSEPCENAFFDSRYSPDSFDDHELPIHILVYNSLLKLPLDVRAICMPRIIFTGGCANVLGLRGRIFDEVSHMVQTRGWDGVVGKAVEQFRTNPKLKRKGSRHRAAGASSSSQDGGGQEQDGVWHDAANVTPEVDPIEEQLKKKNKDVASTQGEMRVIESLGAWSGASLITHLKVPAVALIDRELWLQYGVSGASKANEIDPKAQQRQSLGAAGLMKGASSSAWTLGVWGPT